MSSKGENTEYFGVDTEVFQFMLERECTHPRWTPVADILVRVAKHMKRSVTLEEVYEAVKNTRYTQRTQIRSVTKISPYNMRFRDDVLSHLMLVPGVYDKSWEWGW